MITAAHKTELSRFEGSNKIGVDQDSRQRMKIMKELAKWGYVRPFVAREGFQYFVRTDKQY
jgi:hypothetical protein